QVFTRNDIRGIFGVDVESGRRKECADRIKNIEAGVNDEGTPINELLLGPLAVAPHQGGKGIGSALMRAAILEAKKRGHGDVLL
ncbi:GNAT family N-acetyltransferase, partial [Rhizobium johnstonii]